MLVYSDWMRVLFPEHCPRCRGPTARGFCTGCAQDFARIATPCGKCGLPLPVGRCPQTRNPWHIDALVAPYVYARPLYRQLHALKFNGARMLGRALGLLLAAELDRRALRADALVAVPLHAKRLRERGYNQAEEIARTLAAELDIPFSAAGIRRRKATAPQSSLGSAARGANVAHAFEADRRYEGLRLAVVDDVITTGATVNAVAAALKDVAALSVMAWAVARTPELPGRAGRSSAKQVIEQHADEDRPAEPGVACEGAQAHCRIAVFEKHLLIRRHRRCEHEPAVVPTPEIGTGANKHEPGK
jgi:ComF family protein